MRQIAGPYRQRVVAFIAFFGVIALLGGCLSRNQLPIAAFTFTPSAPVAGSLVSFDASASTDLDGTIVQYAWDFGDGGSGSNAPLTHAYAAAGTYTVTLTVTDDNGASDSVSSDVAVVAFNNQSPTAAFTFTPSAPVAGSLVSFDASASTDPDGTIVQYAWTFGDGTSGSGATASHTYATTGTYTVTLTVTDDGGASDSVSLEVTVGVPQPGNQPPTAAFTGAGFSNSSGVIPRPAAGTEVSFDASTSTDPNGTIVQYAWNFGDGTTGSGVTTTHIFQNPHTDQTVLYTVTLTVTDNDGASDSASMGIDVTPGLPPKP